MVQVMMVVMMVVIIMVMMMVVIMVVHGAVASIRVWALAVLTNYSP